MSLHPGLIIKNLRYMENGELSHSTSFTVHPDHDFIEYFLFTYPDCPIIYSAEYKGVSLC